MEVNTVVKSSFSATINAPIESVDVPSWCFTLPESEYQFGSLAPRVRNFTLTPVTSPRRQPMGDRSGRSHWG
jgi:hypothetical protein